MQSFNIVVKRVYNDGGAKHRVSYPFQLFLGGNFSNEAHETEMHLSPSTKNCTFFAHVSWTTIYRCLYPSFPKKLEDSI